MSEEPTQNGGAPTAQPPKQPRMQALAQYVRDLSFENAAVRQGLESGAQPEVQVSVSLDAKKRSAEHQYEVLHKYKVNAKAKDSGVALFILELEYVGIFSVEGVAEEAMHPFLLIECSRMMFPFERRIVADVTRDGGFPPLNLDNVDFLAIYRQELQRRAQNTTATV